MDSSSRTTGDCTSPVNQVAEAAKSSKKQSNVPIPRSEASSDSPSIRQKIFGVRKSSTDIAQSSSSQSEEESKPKKLFAVFSKKSPRGGEESDDGLKISRPTGGKKVVLTRSRDRGSQIENADDEVTILGDVPTITPAEIRLLFKPPVDMKEKFVKKEEGVTFDFALKYMFEMGQELSRVFENSNRGLRLFDAKINKFVNDLLPQLVKLNIQLQAQHIVEKMGDDKNSLTHKFKDKPGNLKDQKDPLDRILHPVYEMCKELADISKDPSIGMEGLKEKIKSFQSLFLTRFRSKITQMQTADKIQPYSVSIEKKFFDKIDLFLNENLYIDFDIPPDYDKNREILLKHLPDSAELFKQLNSTSSDKTNKLGKDYDYLEFSADLYKRLFDKYFSFLDRICSELISPKILNGEPSSYKIVNEIKAHVDQHCSSSIWATMNGDPSEVKKALLKKIHDKIRYEHLDTYKPVMMRNHRRSLVENIAARPCEIPNFDQSLLGFEEKLFLSKVSAPIDIARIFKLEGFVNCFQKGVILDTEADTPVGRLKTLLQAFSSAFGEEYSEMLGYLAQLIQFPMNVGLSADTFLSDYPNAYKKLVTLTEVEKDEIKTQFSEAYPQIEFEKALKYLHLSQRIFNQSILYYFTYNLAAARAFKFNTKTEIISEQDKGKKEELNQSGFKKTQVNVNVNPKKSRCEIHVVRFDAIVDSRVQIRQEYAYSFNVNEDTFTPPSTISMSINCPRNLAEGDEKIRTLLDILSLVAESLEFPHLEISYT